MRRTGCQIRVSFGVDGGGSAVECLAMFRQCGSNNDPIKMLEEHGTLKPASELIEDIQE